MVYICTEHYSPEIRTPLLKEIIKLWYTPVGLVATYKIKEDINCLVNGTIEEMKSALTKWRENMKKFEYFESMDSV